MERPTPITTAELAPGVEVDGSRLPDDWRERDYKLTLADESRADHANLIRARVVEGIADARALAFADHLEQRARA